MSKKRFIVSLSAPVDPNAAEFRELLARLEEAGFSVTLVLATLGVVLGSAEPAALDALRALPGVTAVEDDGAVGPAAS